MKLQPQHFKVDEENSTIDVPDELMPLFNSVGMQYGMIRHSGKDLNVAFAHIVQIAQKFFTKHPELLIE